MSLTAQSLKIDQRQPGWGDRARTEGPRLLEAAGCPALARELRAALQVEEPMAAMARYLRLELTPGRAPQGTAAVNLFGPLDGLASRPGWVPRFPKRVTLEIPAVPDLGYLGFCYPLGNLLLVGRGFGPGQCAYIEALRLSEKYTLEPLWRRGVNCLSEKMASDGRVVLVEGWDGSAYTEALRVEDGELLWRYGGGELQTPTESLSSRSKMLGAAEGVALLLHSGAAARLDPREPQVLTALDLESGELLWQRPMSLSPRVGANPDGDPSGVRVGEGVVYLYVSGGPGQALDLHTGETLWEAPLAPELSSLYLRGGRLCAWQRSTRTFREYDLRSGSLCCDQTLGEDVGPRLVGMTEGLRLFESSTNHLTAVTREGKTLWRRTLDEERLLVTRLVGDVAVFIGERAVYALNVVGGDEHWRLELGDVGAGAPLGRGLLLKAGGAVRRTSRKLTLLVEEKDWFQWR